jgi:hypothetical protein
MQRTLHQVRCIDVKTQILLWRICIGDKMFIPYGRPLTWRNPMAWLLTLPALFSSLAQYEIGNRIRPFCLLGPLVGRTRALQIH